MTLNLNKYRVNTKDGDFNFTSYGRHVAKFNIPINDLPNQLSQEYNRNRFSLVEKKNPSYRLMFDIDFKPRTEPIMNNKGKLIGGNIISYECYSGREDEITVQIIIAINKVLSETHKDFPKDYIYCDKHLDVTDTEIPGVHLYYPNITVDKVIHLDIVKKVHALLTVQYDFPAFVWVSIVDINVTKNGLRLPYFRFEDEKGKNFYRPNIKKSTCAIPEDTLEQIKMCLLNNY